MVPEAVDQTFLKTRGSGHKQLVSNGGGFKLVVAERDKKQTIIDLREISVGLKTIRLFSRLRLSVPGDGGVFGILVGKRLLVRVHVLAVQFAE